MALPPTRPYARNSYLSGARYGIRFGAVTPSASTVPAPAADLRRTELVVESPDAASDTSETQDRPTSAQPAFDPTQQAAMTAVLLEIFGNQFDAGLAGASADLQDLADAAEGVMDNQRLLEDGRDVLDPPAANQLPALLNRALARMDQSRRDVMLRPDWQAVDRTPGRRDHMVNQLGLATFWMFPGFRLHEATVQAEQGRRADPLASVHVLACMEAGNGACGPNSWAEVSQVAAWVRANGLTIDATELDFLQGIRDRQIEQAQRSGAGRQQMAAMAEAMRQAQGYTPEVVLAMTEDRSFLLVREDPTRCPIAGTYVYSWPVGLRRALEDPGTTRELMARMSLRHIDTLETRLLPGPADSGPEPA